MATRAKRKNPIESAERAYRVFHGHDAEEHFLIKQSLHWHSVLAGCGIIEDLIVVNGDGGIVTLSGFGKDCLLSMNEKRTQLYIKGGDQSVDLRDFGIDPGEAHDLEVLGDLVFVAYHTTKTHLAEEDGGEATYEHEFGDEEDFDDEESPEDRLQRLLDKWEQGSDKAYPTLLYDKLNERLTIAGGDYVIDAEGIIH